MTNSVLLVTKAGLLQASIPLTADSGAGAVEVTLKRKEPTETEFQLSKKIAPN